MVDPASKDQPAPPAPWVPATSASRPASRCARSRSAPCSGLRSRPRPSIWGSRSGSRSRPRSRSRCCRSRCSAPSAGRRAREQHRADDGLGWGVDRRGRRLHPALAAADGLRHGALPGDDRVALLGGLLGVLLMIPLRRGLIVKRARQRSPTRRARPARRCGSSASTAARRAARSSRASGWVRLLQPDGAGRAAQERSSRSRSSTPLSRRLAARSRRRRPCSASATSSARASRA